MGKNSLIKSTSKKKKTLEKDEATKIAAEEEATVKSKASPTPAEPPMKKPEKKSEKISAPPIQKEDVKPSSTQKAQTEKSTSPPNKEPVVEPKKPVEKPEQVEEQKPIKEPTPEEESISPTITYEAPPAPETNEPMDKTLFIGAGCILFLFILVIGASFANTSNYYIKEMPVGIEIWQGKFAPLGEEKIIALPGIDAPKVKKVVYNKHDVNPLIFKHYIGKADALLIRSGIPDYENIKTYLVKSQNYATSNEMAGATSKRLVAIDFSALLYRANVAASLKTEEGMGKSLDYLSQASQLKLEPDQMDLVLQKQTKVKEKLADLKKAQTETQ